MILQLQTEIKIHRALRHTNIVRFDRYFEDKHFAYIALELCSHRVRFISTIVFHVDKYRTFLTKKTYTSLS